MKSRTEYREMEMQVPISKDDNSRVAFDAVRRVHGILVTNLKAVKVVGSKTNGAVVTVSFTKRVRLSKAQRKQA